MKIIRGLHKLNVRRAGSVVTIGVFDGLHVGHVKVIRKAVVRARKMNLKCVVITFDPHPAKVLSSSAAKHDVAPSLISLKHRLRLIEEQGPDVIAVLNFTKAFASLSSEQFVKNVLIARAGAKEIYVGKNFYFGKDAGSSVVDLKRFGRRCGFKVNVVGAEKIGSKRISSSLIRRLIRKGDLRGAAKLLGRPVSMLGTVVRGDSRARKLGYPTANLNPHHEVIPPSGVYAVLIRYGSRLMKGILNIGVRPTFYAPRDQEPLVEVHLFNFNKKIYGEDLEVLFIKKVRDEKKFSSQNNLIKQIRKDHVRALSMLGDRA